MRDDEHAGEVVVAPKKRAPTDDEIMDEVRRIARAFHARCGGA